MLIWGFGNAAHETSRELQKHTQASKFWGPLRQFLLAYIPVAHDCPLQWVVGSANSFLLVPDSLHVTR